MHDNYKFQRNKLHSTTQCPSNIQSYVMPSSILHIKRIFFINIKEHLRFTSTLLTIEIKFMDSLSELSTTS